MGILRTGRRRAVPADRYQMITVSSRRVAGPRAARYCRPVMIELLTLGRVRLVASDGTDSVPAGAQPKRIALLAYLAVETIGGPIRRDALLALFWPELGEDEARRALRQGLHHL